MGMTANYLQFLCESYPCFVLMPQSLMWKLLRGCWDHAWT